MTTELKTLVDLSREYTVEEFDLLPEPGDDSYYELVEGEIRLVPPAGGEHSNISGIIWRAILFFDLSEKLGRAYPPGRFQFGKFKAAPDLFFFSAGRIPEFDRGAITVPADLAVEVWSKSDYGDESSRRIARRKVESYLKNGFHLIWVVRPDNQTVEIYHQGDTRPIVLGVNDELDGEDILPGFKLKIKNLFKN